MSDNIFPVSIDFSSLDDDLLDELGSEFPDADIVETSAFSGQDIVSLLIDTSQPMIKKLAELLQRWKDERKTVNIRVGETEVELKGFNAADSTEMITEIRALIKDVNS